MSAGGVDVNVVSGSAVLIVNWRDTTAVWPPLPTPRSSNVYVPSGGEYVTPDGHGAQSPMPLTRHSNAVVPKPVNVNVA